MPTKPKPEPDLEVVVDMLTRMRTFGSLMVCFNDNLTRDEAGSIGVSLMEFANRALAEMGEDTTDGGR